MSYICGGLRVSTSKLPNSGHWGTDMKLVGSVILLLALGAFTGATPSARADEVKADEIAQVTVVASRLEAPRACIDVSKDDARARAGEASRKGEHQRAAECYLQAGDYLRADRAYMKVTRLAAADSSQQRTASSGDAKSQARRLREAFKKR